MNGPKLVAAEVYPVGVAAERLGLSESVLRKEEAAGRIRFIRTQGRATRVSAVEMARYQANAARRSLHLEELPPCVEVADYLAVVQLGGEAA